MKKDTLCVQAGYNPKSGDPRVAPIVQSTTFYYEKAEDLAALFDLKANGHIYSRLSNPTCAVLEEKIAKLEKGIAGVACSSGMSAIMIATLNVCKANDNIVCSVSIYGGAYNLFSVTLKRYGIETRFFNPDDSKESIEALIDENTKFIYGETIANPSLVVLDFDKISAIAKKHNLLFFVDNTLSSPALCTPIDFGANIIIHSTSKYIDGHATALGGMIVDLGNFNFKGNSRYEEFNIPDESYHGIIYSDTTAPFALKARAQMVRDTGAIMSPMNAFLTNLGCETLTLRMQKHISNAAKVASFLENHEMIEWVIHPSLKSNKYYDLANKYMPNGVTGMMSFSVKGGAKNAAKMMENLKLLKIVTHVADTRSCVLQPATTTHRQLSSEALKEAGISQSQIRLSVGIEDPEDIIADLANALGSL